MTTACRGVRGATVAEQNTADAIRDAIRELVAEMAERNQIDPDDLASAMFTTTPDLNASFPAEAVRLMGWEHVPLLGAVEMAKPGAPGCCIRVLLLWNTTRTQREVEHVYLHGTDRLKTTSPSDSFGLGEPGRPRVNSTALHESTVAIVGLGLMGGSLGLALDGRCARRIGVDLDQAAEHAAVAVGAIDAHLPLVDAVRDAHLVVLAVPAGAAAQLVGTVAGWMRPDAVLTDLASTKRVVCDAMDSIDGPAAVGGHPMCGRELSGVGAAHPALFDGARWAIVPTSTTTEPARRLVGELVAAVGAEPLELGRDAHDRAVATASHLPYAIAQVLVGALADADARTDGMAGALAATGFRSATRLAGGDVTMWRDILATNAGFVREAIDVTRLLLAELADSLDDPEELERLLDAGRSAHAPYRSTT